MAQTASTTKNRVDESVNINEGMAQVGTGVIVSAAALIGLWGMTCMVSALAQYGISGVVRGWFAALIG